MAPFRPILEAAQARAGGAAALEARLPRPKTPAELRALGDDRYLSLMSLRIFRVGLMPRTGDVGRGLQAQGVVERPPKGKGDRRKAQGAFNAWAEETGRPLSHLSMILALSLG